MKKITYIFAFIFFFNSLSFAQGEQPGTGMLREKMIEYIQDKLSLSRGEAEKFQPVFLNYYRDLRKTNQDFKGDRLVLQQKVIELRLRYRDQFKPIMGDKKSNDVFLYERDFVNKVKEVREERLENRKESRSNKRGTDL
jgi:hypothetical protein